MTAEILHHYHTFWKAQQMHVLNSADNKFWTISCFLCPVKSDLIRFQRFKNSFLLLHGSWQGNQQFSALALVRSSLLYLEVDFHSNFLIRCLAAWLQIEKIRSSNHWFLRFSWNTGMILIIEREWGWMIHIYAFIYIAILWKRLK